VLSSEKFGTFKGVFTPSILTILGVIMYLRFGWVVGNAGIVGTVLIVLFAHVVSFATGMSISSIATNRTTRTGGDYYMISRSLGLPMGGAIGIALFFALAFSTSLYLIGFTESFLEFFGLGNTIEMRRLVGTIANIVVAVISYISTSLALRIQYFVLLAIALSLVSLFTGAPLSDAGASAPLWFSANSAGFETVFAVFFPAVTGFTAGVAMSGDLKDPRRAIPLGTLTAVAVGMLVYLAVPIYLGAVADGATLRNDQMVWLKIARFPVLVIAGMFAATLSSAFGSILGAPRYLQALAIDGVVPRLFARGHGPLNEPRIGLAATFFIAEAGILVGELNLVAPLITMFFLSSYGFACLACGIQTWSRIPSFRPTFKTPAWVSFVGAVTCFGIMFKIDTLAMLAATAAMITIFILLQRRQMQTQPIDTWRGFFTAAVHRGILYLDSRPPDGKNWRPNVIVFGDDPGKRRAIADMAGWLFHWRGVTTYCHVVPGLLKEEAPRLRDMETQTREVIEQVAPETMVRLLVTEEPERGILDASQALGFPGMTPNTVLMEWACPRMKHEPFTELVRGLLALDHNLLFLRHHPDRSFGMRKTIDIWWGGRERNVELMLLLAHFLVSSDPWSGAKIRLCVLVDSDAAARKAEARLGAIIATARIEATPYLIIRDERNTGELLGEVSERTDLVLAGLAGPPDEGPDGYVERMDTLLSGVGSALLVRASSQFDYRRLLLDEE